MEITTWGFLGVLVLQRSFTGGSLLSREPRAQQTVDYTGRGRRVGGAGPYTTEVIGRPSGVFGPGIVKITGFGTERFNKRTRRRR